ncbi:MAG: hypothetical protein JWM16_6308 [Verrucomicrobiales bacterium]|nr:hypothetical protein [Verrucomicrobiales bacterium]
MTSSNPKLLALLLSLAALTGAVDINQVRKKP